LNGVNDAEIAELFVDKDVDVGKYGKLVREKAVKTGNRCLDDLMGNN